MDLILIPSKKYEVLSMEKLLILSLSLLSGFITYYHYTDTQKNKNLINYYLSPLNRREIIKKCFYDRSEKKRMLLEIDRCICRIQLNRDKSFMSYERRERIKYLKQLKCEIISGSYREILAELSEEDRKFDNWDSF